MKPKFFVIILFLSLISPTCNSMRFELQSGSTKCITEDIKQAQMSVGKYSVVNPNEGSPLPDLFRITARLTSPRGNSLHLADMVENGDFAFTAQDSGDYTVCFHAQYHSPPTTLNIEMEWMSGVDSRDWSNVARKGHIDVMELELKKMEQTIKNIHDEMFYLREREEEMQELNRGTNSRMAAFSFLSIFVCLSVAGLQLWHLKTFFEKKKLL
ncbi:hypothetical protein V2J09_017431 [Rumex salicifolius]